MAFFSSLEAGGTRLPSACVYVRAVMQAGMPAKSCGKGLATRQPQMPEEAEEAQWSFFCRAGIFSPLAAPRLGRPRRVDATAINTPALIGCFAPRQKLKWKTLQRDRMRGAPCFGSTNSTTNKAGDRQERGCCLPPPAHLSWEADATQRTETSPCRDKGISLDV